MNKTQLTDIFILFLLISCMALALYAVNTVSRYNALVVEYNNNCTDDDIYDIEPIWEVEQDGADGTEFDFSFGTES